MRKHATKLVESIDRLGLRERLFLFAAALFVVGGLWEAVLAAPLTARERIANDKVVVLQERLRRLDDSLSTTTAALGDDGPSQVDRLRALRERVTANAEEMRVFTTDLVDTKEMRLVLEELLRRQDGLLLVNAVNRLARPLLEDEEPADTTNGGDNPRSDAPRLYRHSLVLTLRGSYLDCLRYLEVVERLPWQIYWSRLEFSADEYPVNDIVIELTTLSLQEEWIGV